MKTFRRVNFRMELILERSCRGANGVLTWDSAMLVVLQSALLMRLSTNSRPKYAVAGHGFADDVKPASRFENKTICPVLWLQSNMVAKRYISAMPFRWFSVQTGGTGAVSSALLDWKLAGICQQVQEKTP